jgi:hypothetical protein
MCRCVLAAALIAASSMAAVAGPLDRPLPEGAKVLRESTFAVGPTGQVSDIVLLRAGAFTLDYVVAGSSKVRTLILTDEQFQQATSGQKPKPPFLMGVALQGTGSQSLRLSKGTYHIVYMGGAAAQMSYRAWWKDE